MLENKQPHKRIFIKQRLNLRHYRLFLSTQPRAAAYLPGLIHLCQDLRHLSATRKICIGDTTIKKCWVQRYLQILWQPIFRKISTWMLGPKQRYLKYCLSKYLWPHTGCSWWNSGNTFFRKHKVLGKGQSEWPVETVSTKKKITLHLQHE